VTPTISVIIPARNEAAQIVGTVRAAIAAADALAKSATMQILVVDNASTDATTDLVNALADEQPTVRLVRCPALGAARARNAGAAAATGGVLVFVDADTQIPAAGLARVAAHVRDGYDAGIFALAPQSPGVRAWCWWTFWNHVRRLPIARAKALPAFMFCTRGVFDRFGPFDERVAIGEEWPILAGRYHDDPHRFVYDRTLAAHTSGRRMDLQPFGYTRTYVKYLLAILAHPARVRYTDAIREAAQTTASGA
jgi:glycosyltransferase involved in cell wall biosynthesis